MSISIPPAGGVPGISGPPDWFNAPPTGSFDLDDVRWRGATKTTFGAGGAGSNSLRATQAIVGSQQYIFLSFRAAFVQALSDQYDTVYLGLQRTGGTKAMVIQMQVHGPTFTPAGPPSANPPANIASVQISTRLNTDTTWTVQAMSPSWISANARMWLQSATDVMSDPNNRWAIELRIPAMAAGDIAANSGPNLGTDFDMWYVIHGGTSTDSPVILADYRTSGSTTEGALQNGDFPVPFPPGGVWDEFLLTSGPAAFGGVALEWGDVVVQNAAHGEGWEIANGQSNTFVARPRNYRPNVPANTINAAGINATFRIANWGSIADANAPWDYVPGNSATIPVVSNAAIPPLPAGNNPPATNPIALTTTMNLAPGKNTHQCVFVTLSGTNLTFLNDSIYENMNYDHASLLEREAEISIVGLMPFSPQPRDVYLAIEEINMLRSMPTGTNEGLFLESSMSRLIAQGGPLAKKLETAQAMLADMGDLRSRARLDGRNERLKTLVKILSEVGLTDNDLDQLFPTFRVHPYYDTGERVTGKDGNQHPVLRAQSSFGIYAYHEGGLDGWQTSLQGAQRIADNLYLLAVPNNGTAKVNVRVQGVAPGEERIPEDPIIPIGGSSPKGCLELLLFPFTLVVNFIRSLLGLSK